MHTGGGRSFYSWTVLDPVGNRVKSGNTRSRAEAVLEAEKAKWRLQQPKPTGKPSRRLALRPRLQALSLILRRL